MRTFSALDKQAQATLVVLDQTATVDVEYELNSRNCLVGITLLCLLQYTAELFDFILCFLGCLSFLFDNFKLGNTGLEPGISSLTSFNRYELLFVLQIFNRDYIEVL
ncbi:Uncharacterised protein [Yersinia frederiksenii]|nr:Uncharacterised protein [Yersinia frederiksenii]